MNNKQCRIGVIGAGRIGKLHAEHIKYHLPQFNLLAIADPNLDKQWAERLSVPSMSHNVDDVLFNSELDAVLIASPSNLHLEHLQAASESGKAVFCEKPIGLNRDDIVSVLKLVNANNTLLQIGFNRRFDPSFANLQKRVQANEIGEPHIVKITSRDPLCPPTSYVATSGGMFMDMTIHDFDMSRFLTQSDVVEVYATGARLINPDFEAYNDVDTAIIQLRFANGALGVIDNSRQALYGYDQRIEVFGANGMLLAANQVEHSVTHYTKSATAAANPLYFFLERYHQAFIEQLHSFYESWVNNKPGAVSGEDALKALDIAIAANQSLETKQPVLLK